jgi:negative regulator of sigma E activity
MDHQAPEPHESLWRPLTASERAKLHGQPDLELEARLTEALARLDPVPVPSNFTARVMDAVELEEARSSRASKWRWNWHALLPRVAVAMALLLFAGLGVQHYEVSQQRSELASSLSQVASSRAVPSVDALENLDAIQRMSQSARADTELLSDLQ